MRVMMPRALRFLVLEDYGGAFARSKAHQSLLDAGHQVQIEEGVLREKALVDAAGDADALLLTQQRTPLPQAVVSQLPKLAWVVNTGKNVSHLDQDACSQQGVRVVVGGGGNPYPAAELTWALILSSSRRIVENNRSLRAGEWQSSGGTGLRGKTLGILGLGNIGGAVAAVGAAFGMRVLCYCRPGGSSAKAAAEKGFDLTGSREEFFREADVLSVHIPQNAETIGSISRADLALMKITALFVNTSRAGLVETGALETALRKGRPGFAAVDVFEHEPAPVEHPLLALPNVLCTPHLGYCTQENMEGYYSNAVAAFLKEHQDSEVVSQE